MRLASRVKGPRVAGPSRFDGRWGFTLLEVMLAATIFAIAMGALFFTFRTGVRAWQTGHAASEINQTARVAQDVMIRDLHNLFYRPEASYNGGFRAQINALGLDFEENQFGDYSTPAGTTANQLVGRTAKVDQKRKRDPLLNLFNLTLPIDISLHGEDGGLLDSLSFARYQRPRTSAEAESWGIRRVRYYVLDGVLYREESSPFGFRPGEDLQEYYGLNPGRGDFARLFYREGTDRKRSDRADRLLQGDDRPLIPNTYKVSEPLCEGVEIFNITYGYYQYDMWVEADSWDSSRFQNRFPIEQSLSYGFTGPGGVRSPRGGRGACTETSFQRRRGRRSRRAVVRGQIMSFQPVPDNLPGYIAIQLGVRGRDRGGRLRSYTFFVSLPLANEQFDLGSIDEASADGYESRRTRETDGGNRLYGRY